MNRSPSVVLMMHRLLAGLVLLSPTGLLHARAVQAAPQPNIVFFIADDMRPYHFNCLSEGRGKNLTPNLDRLVREGVLLTGQHVVSPICTPSRYSCLTGRYPSRAQTSWFKQRTEQEGQTVVEFNTYIQPAEDTLARRLQAAGYVTGMVGKNHVIEASGLERFPNFDADAHSPENTAQLKRNHQRVCQAIRGAGFDYAASVYHNNPDFIGLHEVAVQNMDWITAGALDFITTNVERSSRAVSIDQNRRMERQGNTARSTVLRDSAIGEHPQPFFLYFATTVPHGPTSAERSWNADPRITAEGYLDEAPNVQPPRDTIEKRLKAAGLPVNKDTANMLWLDDALGALLTELKDTGALDHTVIFFFNDHGQNAKGTLYQGGVHNPSIVWRKGGFPCGSELTTLLSNVDFAPTILDFAGAEQPGADMDGKSFRPHLEGQAAEDEGALYFELGYARAIRKGNWKYLAVRYPERVEQMSMDERTRVLEEWNAERRRKHLNIVTEDPSDPFSHLTPIPGGGGAESESTGKYPAYYDRDQLYDLSADPKEQNNLADDPEYAAQLKCMKQELRTILESLPGDFEL